MQLRPLLNDITKSIFTCVIALLLTSTSLSAQVTSPGQMTEVGVDEKLGHHIPLDLTFIDENGATRTLSDFVDGLRPTLLTLVYYNCPMLCDLILTGVSNSLADLEMDPGKDYNVVSISIDPNDTPKKARDFKGSYIKQLGWNEDEASHWNFLVSPDNQVQKLADSLGYRYKDLENSDDFAHGSSIFVISPTGQISRYLYGVEFKSFDMKLSFIEAKKEKTKSTVESLLLFCYNYDPDSRGFVLQARNIMKLGGVLTLIFLALLYAWIYWSKKKRQN